MFTIKDKKAEGYNTPFFQPTFGLAERAFQDACKDPQTSLNKYPEDFSLFYLGTFDTSSGNLELESSPKHVCDASVQNV